MRTLINKQPTSSVCVHRAEMRDGLKKLNNVFKSTNLTARDLMLTNLDCLMHPLQIRKGKITVSYITYTIK